MDKIIEWIKDAFAYLKNLVTKVIQGIISFGQHILGWFRGLSLRQGRDIPFLGNTASPQFRTMLKEAPVKDVGVFKGVFNTETDEISHAELLSADGLDAQTKEIIGTEPITVLS